jgi:hypothetical protein
MVSSKVALAAKGMREQIRTVSARIKEYSFQEIATQAQRGTAKLNT